MLWTDEQQAAARAESWELVDTVDNGKTIPVLRIFGTRAATNQQAQQHVLANAKMHSKLHIAALNAISKSAVYAQEKK